MGRKPPDSRVLEDWTERDLTAAAQAGGLAPAFEMDDPVGLASDVLESGRNVIVLRLKQVAKGELDSLLEAWRLRSAPAVETVGLA